MTSIQTHYAQQDNRLETITMTGNINNNGSKGGVPADRNPAYAAIDLRKSKNFSIDTSILRPRSDVTPQDQLYLLRIYISSTKPPSSYQNFEFDIFIIPPGNEQRLFIEIYANQVAAETENDRLFGISNRFPDGSGDYSDQSGFLSFKTLNNSIVLKTIPPSYSN